MANGEICKRLLLQVYDNVLTLHEYFTIRKRLTIDMQDEDFQSFMHQTVIAFSEDGPERETAENGVVPATGITALLDRIVTDCTSEYIPKEQLKTFLFRYEKFFSHLLNCITASLEEHEKQKWASGAQVMVHLLRDCSLYTGLPGPNYIQRTGK